MLFVKKFVKMTDEQCLLQLGLDTL